MTRARKWLVVLFVLAAAGTLIVARRAGGAVPAPSLAAKPLSPEARVVTVGLYLNQIYVLSLKENKFEVDCYVWFRWKGDDIKPHETFGVVGGKLESKEVIQEKDLPSGEKYVCLRVHANITKFWDISRYPLDNQTLEIALEEEGDEEDKIRYRQDAENSGYSPDIRVPGWQSAGSTTEEGVGTYLSNFGDTTLASGQESRYGRYTFRLQLRRGGIGFFFKVFFAVWISAAISFLTYFIKVTDVDPRFGLGVGALFTAIASEYIVTSALPDTNLLTLADQLHIVAFGFIFISVAQSTVSLWLAENDKPDASKRLDRAFAFAVPLIYIVTNVLLVLRG